MGAAARLAGDGMILVLNGPNLNFLGMREPEVYGSDTLDDLETACAEWAHQLGVQVTCRQSNHEGVLIDWLQLAATEGYTGVILNAGGFTHTSVALRDAVASIRLPVIEVHLSNVFAREEFRHRSLLSAVCRGSISGLGSKSYLAALTVLAS